MPPSQQSLLYKLRIYMLNCTYIFVANEVSDLIKMTKNFSMHTHTTPCSVVPFSNLRCTKQVQRGGGGAADIFCSDRNNSKSIADIHMKISGDLKNIMKLHSANFQA